MTEASVYQVLARKYRPETFADLVGQDAMVQTLRNAFEAERIAQAFLMTGIRGTGKTTTARIIAKGMNCIGLDGKGSATVDPCGVCENCTSIMAGRHVDVLEMDAASRTGVGDIREIIDSVAYRAASARYKIYIIDEVHMLSTNAFNALLKTLEEPPAHVKFIFATTEIRKVPVTVLSRCQRFDLRRIEPEVMISLLKKIAKAEEADISDEALGLITRAAEGSVRDAQSLLDQAISHGAGQTTAEQVRTMLGLADRGRILDLFDLILQGDAAGALGELSGQYADGADPMAILRDLAEISHWISVIKITPSAADDPTASPDERNRGLIMAEALPMRILTRVWQMLLSSLEELARSPNSMMAAEMAVIRLTHVADLPTPDELIRKLNSTAMPAAKTPMTGNLSTAKRPTEAKQTQPEAANIIDNKTPYTPNLQLTSEATVRKAQPIENTLVHFAIFEDVLNLIRDHRDIKLLVDVETTLRLISYSPGRIEFEPTNNAPKDLAQRLGSRLQTWTDNRWAVSIGVGGSETIAEKRDEAKNALKVKANSHPFVQAVFDAFPKAEILEIRTPQDVANLVQVDALPEVEDEWDPFDDN